MYRCQKYVQLYTYVHGTVLIRPCKYSKTFCADFYKTYGTRGTEFPCWVSQTHTNTALTHLDPRYRIKALSHKNEKCTRSNVIQLLCSFVQKIRNFLALNSWKFGKCQWYPVRNSTMRFQTRYYFINILLLISLESYSPPIRIFKDSWRIRLIFHIKNNLQAVLEGLFLRRHCPVKTNLGNSIYQWKDHINCSSVAFRLNFDQSISYSAVNLWPCDIIPWNRHDTEIFCHAVFAICTICKCSYSWQIQSSKISRYVFCLIARLILILKGYTWS